MHYNESAENYLETILMLSKKLPVVRAVDIANELGYKTVFWSFAYKDWDTSAQPTVEEAFDMVVDNYHNGCIMLLHAVSEANTNALDDMIKFLKNEGYEFRSLMELP